MEVIGLATVSQSMLVRTGLPRVALPLNGEDLTHLSAFPKLDPDLDAYIPRRRSDRFELRLLLKAQFSLADRKVQLNDQNRRKFPFVGAGRGGGTLTTLRSADFESAFSTVAGGCKWTHVDRITSYISATSTLQASRIALQVEALDTGAKYHQKYPREFAEKVSDGESRIGLAIRHGSET